MNEKYFAILTEFVNGGARVQIYSSGEQYLYDDFKCRDASDAREQLAKREFKFDRTLSPLRDRYSSN